MKIEIINKDGKIWKFDSVAKAKPHIKKERLSEYEIIDGIRVYDDREAKVI